MRELHLALARRGWLHGTDRDRRHVARCRMTNPFHTVFCINGPCPWFCDAARELGLPRDPDLTEEVYGQLSIAALEGAY